MTELLFNGMNVARGAIDYFRRPEMREPWGGPFNGQAARRRLFEALCAALPLSVIVETGCYRGSTTEFFGRTGLTVFAAEADAYAYGFARARFLGRSNVKVLLSDSRAMLRRLLVGPRQRSDRQTQFFYLDAHWGEDLPLAEEIEIIFSRRPNAIVMIDDFAVPGDDGYRYDDYGPGKALTYAYICPLVASFSLSVFYPSTPSERDIGAKRGCVILVKSKESTDTLLKQPLLRQG